MKFWEDKRTLRVVLIALFFAGGLVLVLAGWRMTGKMAGLGLMLAGLVLLLAALFVYNGAYADPKRKK